MPLFVTFFHLKGVANYSIHIVGYFQMPCTGVQPVSVRVQRGLHLVINYKFVICSNFIYRLKQIVDITEAE